MGGQSNPCDSLLPAVCSADVSGPDGVPDGLVNVQDLLTVIGNWGQVGDGTFRPQGDCAPMDYGDCTVNVQDLLAVIAQWGSDCVERGACCYGDGACVDNTAEGDCDGDWLGANSDCAADCVSGACCFPDASCASATEAGCTGVYQGDGTDCGSVVCEEAPDNNTCDSAIAIGEGTHDIDNTTATTDGPNDFTNCDNFGVDQIYNDLYWSYTASCSGTATVSTCNTVDFDSRISIYDDCDFTQVACNDDALSGACGLTSEVSWYCAEGVEYIVRIVTSVKALAVQVPLPSHASRMSLEHAALAPASALMACCRPSVSSLVVSIRVAAQIVPPSNVTRPRITIRVRPQRSSTLAPMPSIPRTPTRNGRILMTPCVQASTLIGPVHLTCSVRSRQMVMA
jgi:hypothetical protein